MKREYSRSGSPGRREARDVHVAWSNLLWFMYPGYELSRVESVGFLVNGEPVDVMGLLVHHSKAKEVVGVALHTY